MLNLTVKFLRRITADASTVRAIGTVVSQGVFQKWINRCGRLGRVSRLSSLGVRASRPDRCASRCSAIHRSTWFTDVASDQRLVLIRWVRHRGFSAVHVDRRCQAAWLAAEGVGGGLIPSAAVAWGELVAPVLVGDIDQADRDPVQ